MRGRPVGRRGVTAVLAMLFMVLFAVLALGFVAMVGTSVQIASNDRDATRSILAAESAKELARLHLANVDVGDATLPDEKFDRLFAELTDDLAGTPNLGGHAPTLSVEPDGSRVIDIPGRTASVSGPVHHWIDFGDDIGIGRVSIRQTGADVQVTTVGRLGGDAPARMAIRYDYGSVREAWTRPEWVGEGVLTRSPVDLTNGAKVTGGNVTTATTNANVASLTMTGGARIAAVAGRGGSFNWVDGGGLPSIKNGSKIDGSVTRLSEPPAFPIVDGRVFEVFVPSAAAPAHVGKVITKDNIHSLASNARLINVRIKANPSGSTISFNNSVELNGVIWIESPNKVSFGGGCRIHGVIVTEHRPNVPPGQCEITLANGVRMDGVETLDRIADGFTDAQWTGERLAALRALSGCLILAPGYRVVLAGGARTYAGQLVADSFHISNGYKGTIAGNLIGLDPDAVFTMEGGTEITFSPATNGSSGGGTGLYSGSRYRIRPETYAEVPLAD